jgi:hypothetical protein
VFTQLREQASRDEVLEGHTGTAVRERAYDDWVIVQGKVFQLQDAATISELGANRLAGAQAHALDAVAQARAGRRPAGAARTPRLTVHPSAMTTPESTMPLPNPDQPVELSQLTAVSSVVDVVAGYVDDLAPIPAGELAEWVAGLAVPASWQVLPLDASAPPLARIAVRGQRPEGGWDACDTISVFRFTGFPPRDVVEDNAECTLRDLGARGIRTTVAPPPLPGVAAVRSGGHFHISMKLMYAQYETYIAGSDQPGQGRLIQHSIFVDYGSYFRLGRDVGQLTGTIRDAFFTSIGADPADAKWFRPGAVVAKRPGGATDSPEPGSDDGTNMVAIELTPEERYFICSALIEWSGVATGAPLPIKTLGIATNWIEFDSLVSCLETAIVGQEPMSALDWTRTLFLTEVSWASNVVGAGLDFALVTSISDEEAVKLLRSIQWKLSRYYRPSLLFPGAGRPRRTSDGEAPKDMSS